MGIQKQPERLKDFTIHGTPHIPLHIYNQYYEHGGLAVPTHWHKEIELIYMERGCMELSINTTHKRVYENEFYCVNSQEIHQIYSIGATGCVHHALVFSPDILGFDYWDAVQNDYIHPLLSGQLLFPQTICTTEPAGRKVVELFKEILFLYQEKRPGWYMDLKGCLYRMLAVLAQEDLFITATEDLRSNNQKMDRTKKVLTYIHEHYTERIYLEDLAQEMGMNSQYFCRYFKNIFQKSPIEYINQYRISQAMKILQRQDLSVLEVCMYVGFENPSYFIKLFKKQTSMTPHEYKKQFGREAKAIKSGESIEKTP